MVYANFYDRFFLVSRMCEFGSQQVYNNQNTIFYFYRILVSAPALSNKSISSN